MTSSGSQNAAERRVVEFLHSYRASFEAFDADRVTSHFTWPVHVTSDAEQVSIASAPARDAWKAQIERLIAMYRRIGVSSAIPAEIRVELISPNVMTALVQWRLFTADGQTLYQFRALYSLVVLNGELKITAILHDEAPRLRDAVARLSAV